VTIQLIVVDTSPDAVSRRLVGIASQCEIFSMDSKRIGVSIPQKVHTGADEDWIHEKLLGLTYYDLYTGEWCGRQ
jgi:hypothetical protein